MTAKDGCTLLSISLFERGLGGRMSSVHRGVKFYDKEILNQVLL